MANLLLLLLLITISILIILMSVSVRFIYFDRPTLRFDFLFFNITLLPSSRERIKNEKNNIFKSSKNRLARAVSLKKSLDYLLKHSDVKIEKIDLKLAGTNPASFVLQEKNISTLIFIIIAYLSFKSGNLITEDTHFISYGESDSKTYIDVSLTSTFFHILIAIFIFSRENAKKKRKRVKRVVREQNE